MSDDPVEVLTDKMEDEPEEISPGSPPSSFQTSKPTVNAPQEEAGPTLFDPSSMQSMSSVSLHAHSGPWPSPSTLQAYKEIDEELFDKVLVFSERSLDANIKLAERQMELQERNMEFVHQANQRRLDIKEKELTLDERQLAMEEQEKQSLQSINSDNSTHSLRGQLLAAFIFLVFLGAVIYLATINAPWVAFFVAGLPLVGVCALIAIRQRASGKSADAMAQVASALIVARQPQKPKELEAKPEDPTQS